MCGEQIRETEDRYREKVKLAFYDNSKKAINEADFEEIKPNIDIEKLKFYNGIGGFSEDGKEYIIRQNKNIFPPTPWSNILANEKFGSIITNNMGGFTYSKNSRLNRISAWANTPSNDVPSEIIYLRDVELGNAWTLNANVMPDDRDYYMIYGFGYVKGYHSSLGLIQETETFVPRKDSLKVNIIRLKNTLANKRRIKFVYYIKPVLGEDEIKTSGNIKLRFDETNNVLFAKNIYGETLSKNVFISSSEKVRSYTGNNLSFLGKGDLYNPSGIYGERLSMENALGVPSCIALEFEVDLDAFEEKKIVLMLGEEEEESSIYGVLEKYKNVENASIYLRDVKEHWRETLRKVQVKTNNEELDFMLNGWAMYQTISSRLYSRSAYYQSGGAFGFRDQLQDSLSCKYIDINMLKKQILKHARHQFEEGDVEHWWHDETKRGIRTRFSDDLLWLPYAVCEYILFTGDYSILDEEVPYLQGNLLNFGEDEKYDIHEESNLRESIYKHAIRAIEKSLDFGEHGLPKIGSR